ELNGGYVAFGGNPKGGKTTGKGKIKTGNMSYLFDFEELNGGYVVFGGNPKGGKISRKGKIRIGKLDFDDVYFVKELKFNLFSVSQMCDKNNSVLFTDTECLVLSPDFKLPDENQVILRVPGEKICVQDKFDVEKAGKEKPEFEGRKPESEVNVSQSSSAQSKKHDDKTKREAKGKSLVEFLIGYRNLSVEFEDFFDNNINEDNVAGILVPAVWQLSLNNINTFCAAGPSNAAASPTYGKSSCIDTFQLPDDLNMPELEDITYSDDEDDVGAEADFNNLETTITEEGINYKEVFTPAARIEAIRLFLSYASFMGFMVYQMDVKSAFLYGTIEEEVYVCQPPGFKDPDYPDKVYKVVKALYCLHQALRAWYETLVNYLLEMVFKKARYVVPKSWIYYLE
nr:putative ribonuclease H-like domain-containing protein [Tanacetum cinerariifolium]